MRGLKRKLGLLAAVADISLMMTGCVSGVIDLDDDFKHSGKVEVSAVFTRTFDLDDQTAIRIIGANGAIRVWGVPGATRIVIDAVRTVRSDTRSDAEAHLKDVQVLAEANQNEFRVKTIQPDYSYGRSYIVDYEITVPADMLPTITNGNGSIRLEGFHADVDVSNGNGEVSLVDVEGSSWVSVGNGEISAGVFLPAGGQIVHSIGNGTISLEVQPEVSASFGAKVGNGTISVTGLNLSQTVASPRQLHGVLGSGDGLIDLAAGNGQIRVRGG